MIDWLRLSINYFSKSGHIFKTQNNQVWHASNCTRWQCWSIISRTSQDQIALCIHECIAAKNIGHEVQSVFFWRRINFPCILLSKFKADSLRFLLTRRYNNNHIIGHTLCIYNSFQQHIAKRRRISSHFLLSFLSSRRSRHDVLWLHSAEVSNVVLTAETHPACRGVPLESTEPRGLIQSPGYHNRTYPNGAYCQWLIVAPRAEVGLVFQIIWP